MATDFMQRLIKQALICFALMACLTLMALFSSKIQWGFLGYPALLIGGTFFTTLGVVIGDALRRFTKPDIIFANDGIGLFKQKVFWLIGPQVIGWIIGFIATQSFIAKVPGVAAAEAKARIEAANLAQLELAMARPVPMAAPPAAEPVEPLPAAAPAELASAVELEPEHPLDPAMQACVEAKLAIASTPAADGSERIITTDMRRAWVAECGASADTQGIGQCVMPKLKPHANTAGQLALKKPVPVMAAPDPTAARVQMLTDLTTFSVSAASQGYVQLVTVPDYTLPDPDQAAGKVVGWVLLADMDFLALRNCN